MPETRLTVAGDTPVCLRVEPGWAAAISSATFGGIRAGFVFVGTNDPRASGSFTSGALNPAQ
ncbi:hypothetical protein C9413_22985 [Rhizobium sp. SEMIA 4085]|uniref:Uncharacterized protein n=1 Tax=Rhizobium gallicum bv. gallicum R602sp TaxID=1041138 RepID=A0A0B4X772_9HYPH|nr:MULTISPECIES: hypothetical protein [Rhizobium]AJD43884.1 hypothetical protein RGR602_PB00352 [Rhizobium gallicum bv. gallicum R602sp]NNH32226.1 hypothetical protein [Rhizobium sp. SEMIA 4085]